MTMKCEKGRCWSPLACSAFGYCREINTMNAADKERAMVERMACAICRVQLNGGDPYQPAMRWNGTQCEPQEFPAWHDYRNEAVAALAALRDVPQTVAE